MDKKNSKTTHISNPRKSPWTTKSIKPITFHFLRKSGGRGETGNNKAEEGGRGLIPYTILGRTRRCLHQNGLDTHTHTRANLLFRPHICLPACVVRPFSLAGLSYSRGSIQDRASPHRLAGVEAAPDAISQLGSWLEFANKIQLRTNTMLSFPSSVLTSRNLDL